VLVEGGSQVLGALFDLQLIDESHVFIAPKVIGGGPSAPSGGVERLASALRLGAPTIETVGDDAYIHGRIERAATT
jgi:diaminohydroxyphosphoribosylaminopyrimidine deaminase/5-amino-6-(5-phosphoribosylamino)uracil reductase